MDLLTREELQRYDRQMIIEDFGLQGQEKLKKSRVFIGGAGGLGSPVAVYLSAAGVGEIKIADNDRVEISNLNRQILHWEEDIGKRKVDSAREKLIKLNPTLKLEITDETICEDNILEMLEGFDVIVDGMDNLHTRLILNRAAIIKKIPFFHGAVRGMDGRAMTIIPGKTACLRCAYHGEMPAEKFPVLGTAPGIIGSIQAAEVIKYLTGIGELLAGRMLHFDGLDMRFKEFKLKRNPECKDCGRF